MLFKFLSMPIHSHTLTHSPTHSSTHSSTHSPTHSSTLTHSPTCNINQNFRNCNNLDVNVVCSTCQNYGHINRYCPLLKCYKCSGNHHIRDCLIHKLGKNDRRLITGDISEKIIASGGEHEIFCPVCKNSKLKSVEAFMPSLDLVCMDENCGQKYEVKSRCFSDKVIPFNLKIKAGNYKSFKKGIESGLNLIFIIYGIDEKQNQKFYREIRFFSNSLLRLFLANCEFPVLLTNYEGPGEVINNNKKVIEPTIFPFQNKKSFIAIPDRNLGKLIMPFRNN
jgi:hypothetical protein